MEEFLQFALVGLGVGAMYVLMAHGLIAIYRGSGVLNFALGAIGMVGVYVEWELKTNHGVPFIPAALVGIAVSAAIGALVQMYIMRPLRNRSSLIRVVATLGVLLTLQSLAILRYTAVPKSIRSDLPTNRVHIWGDVFVTAERLILVLIAVVITILMYALYRYTKFGLATSAVAENERVASSLGLSPNRIATINWALGSALAGLAAILIAPIVTLQPTVMTGLVLAATATALVAGFRSFPVALIAGLVIGVCESEVNAHFVDLPGVGKAVPFVFIVLWMTIRGQAIPQRDYLLQKLPSIGTGRIRWGLLLTAVAIVGALLLSSPNIWVDAYTITICYAIMIMSVVVLTGYTGQLSLAQFALAGFGAFVAGRSSAVFGLSFVVALLLGVLATIPLGILLALPAIRTRGINLAIITLGLGTALELIVFDNQNLTGGVGGTIIDPPTLFGYPVDSGSYPGRYGIITLIALVLITLMVGNLRRGRSGRRLIAVRTNERAAAALGINVRSAKLYSFAVAAGIAALGGVLLAFRQTSLGFAGYTAFGSISLVADSVIGGLGYLAGPAFGGTIVPAGLDARILDSFGDGVSKWIPLIGGVSVLLLVLLNQDGVVKETMGQAALVRSWLGKAKNYRLASSIFIIVVSLIFMWLSWHWNVWPVGVVIGICALIKLVRKPYSPPAPTTLAEENAELTRVAPRTLEVKNATVRYGGTTAVDHVDLTIRPGEILGLIGPNGAGKTSFIDAVTGFTPMSEGQLLLDGQDITDWSTVRRARQGIARSFQSLELFEDSSVIDNLRAASDPRDFWSYLRDLVYPVSPPLPSEVISAVREFKLGDDLDTQVEDLSYGKRRLLAIARAVAGQPSVLLLDEPAAGLTEAETLELAHLVKRLASEWGMAVLLVEHDINFVMAICDQIVVLDFGKKISEGTPEVVRNDPIVISAYLGTDDPTTDESTAGVTV